MCNLGWNIIGMRMSSSIVLDDNDKYGDVAYDVANDDVVIIRTP